MTCRLNVGEWSPSDFYLRPSLQAQGVALHVYLNPGIMFRDDTIENRVDLERTPIVIFNFDGEEVRLASAILRYRSGLSQQDQFYFVPIVPAEDPIAADVTTSITPHESMAIRRGPGMLQLANGASQVAALATAPRSMRIVLPAEEPVLSFRAPSAVLPLPTRPLPFFVGDNQRQFFVYPTNRLASWLVGGPYFFTVIGDQPQLHVTAVDHPQISRFRAILRHDGVDGLLAIATQSEPASPDGVRGSFATYGPDPERGGDAARRRRRLRHRPPVRALQLGAVLPRRGGGRHGAQRAITSSRRLDGGSTTCSIRPTPPTVRSPARLLALPTIPRARRRPPDRRVDSPASRPQRTSRRRSRHC